MHFSLAFSLATWASISAVTAIEKRVTPSLYLVGDSTMAHHPTSIQGWAVEISKYLQDINVVNMAISGSSARSYTRNGNFTTVKDRLSAGDVVLFEFGHNDGGSPDTSDRAEVFGVDDSVTETVTLLNGTIEVVHTFDFYIKAMIDGAVAKGATVIVSSQTPDNPYENSTTITNSPPRFVAYAKNAAAAKGVDYVDHFAAVISLFTELGKTTVDSYYPLDHTHTNTAGANQVARAFVSGLKCPSAKSALAQYINPSGEMIGAAC